MGESERKKRKRRSPNPKIVNVDDRISQLPDSLIHHILFFLEMRDVIKTCVLSKRWRYLWTSVPVLDFRNFGEDDWVVSRFIDLSLLRYNAVKIRRFNAHLYHSVDPCHLDSWLYFAMNRHVEELDIQLFYKGRYEDSYSMPPGLLDSGSLRVLKLSGFDLTHPGSFSFRSLVELHLSFVKLTYLSTSVCPCLEILIIVGCHNDLEIDAPNQKLRYLKLVDLDLEDSNLTVYAPYLLSVEFSGWFGRIYNFKDISSVTCATLNCYNMDSAYFEFVEKKLTELLANLSHVKTLKLCQRCMKVLACRETCLQETPNLSATRLEVTTNLRRWELPGFTSLLMSSQYLESLIVNISDRSSSRMVLGCRETCLQETPNLSATRLEVTTNLRIWELSGFISLLMSSQYLESLIVNISDSSVPMNIGFDDDYYRNSKHNEFWDVALSATSKLRTVTIRDFLGTNSNRLFSQRESLQSPLLYILEKWEKEIMLVRRLLKGCKILNKLDIITIKDPLLSLRSELLLSLKNELQGFPRASENADICIS